ncbi:hypothetical protein HDV06_006530 [Boothiomyces sp. JEL0866]|nr:hypothetical protein HDV06_006530 [Boothiomyces sp. JEL0866]
MSNTLQYVEGRHSKRQGAIAGFFAGFAILFESRQNRIGFTQQFFMRSMQAGKNALKQRNIPTLPHGDTILTAKVPKQFLVSQAGHLYKMRSLTYKADDTMVNTLESLGGTARNIQRLKDHISTYGGRMTALPCCIYHPKDDSCVKCATVKWAAVYRQMAPVYFTLNMVPLLVLKTKQLISRSVFYSGVFISSYTAIFQYCLCLLCNSFPTTSPKYFFYFLGAFSGLSILFEQKQKRAELAMYCLPKAVQSLYRMLVAKGKIVYVPHLEILASCVSWSVIMSLYQKEPEHVSTMLYKMMKAVLGTY